MYRELDVDRTIETLHTLRNRVGERFPDSSLQAVCGELTDLARETRKRIESISQPHMPTRLGVALVLLLAIGLTALMVTGIVVSQRDRFSIVELIQVTEPATNEIVLIGAALLFLFGMEVRIKRTRALKVLHELRAMSHVIDMHQLTKDPNHILGSPASRTKSSPQRTLTSFELTRYLDYCSEMLSLIGKLAALYAQSLPDTVVVAAVNDIETLTNGMSRKIWQKIVMLEKDPANGPLPSAPASESQTPTDD
ncbi:MAG: hypothetical protein R3C19_15905 [Planctomycetaceae bacterium]